jgi:hypothetical protein
MVEDIIGDRNYARSKARYEAADSMEETDKLVSQSELIGLVREIDFGFAAQRMKK